MAKLSTLQHIYIYIYIYIYIALWSYYLVQVWGFWKLLSGPSLFFLKHRLPKKNYKIGVSAHFLEKKHCAQKFESYYPVQVGVFLNAPNLDQRITSKNVIFFVIFCFETCAEIPILIVFLKNNQKTKMPPPKNDNFSHFAKHRFIKKSLCCNPLSFEKLVFFELAILKEKH